MKSFFFICLTNCLDFGILEKYLKCFSQERKVDRYKLIFLFLFCTITTSIVNMYKNPTINLLCSICMIYLYSLSFSYSRLYYIILPILYIGLGFVSEPIGFLLTLRLETQISMEISFYISALICEFIRYLLVRAICHSWAIQLPNLSKQMSLLLFLIPLSSVFISCMAIYLTGTYDNLTGNVLCLAIILLVLLTNILTFAIFHKLSIVIADNYKNELLLQEVNMKEQYYREIEAGNKKVQEIKHDLKNRLIAFYAIEKANVDFKKEFQKILLKFFALILAGTVLGVILSVFLADFALGILYGAEIKPYTGLFIPVFFIAVLIAVNASLFSVCTLIREIRSQYAVGLVGIASAFLLSVTAVKTWSLDGTIVAFAGTLILQIAIQLFLIVRKVRKMNGNRK